MADIKTEKILDSENKEIQVFVKMHDGHITVTIEDMTFWEFKEWLYDTGKTGVPPEFYWGVYRAKNLQDNEKLSEYKIREGTTIQLIVRAGKAIRFK